MIKIFKTISGNLEEVNEAGVDCWVLAIKPDKEEMARIQALTNMDEVDLKSTIDIDERPHIQNEDEYTMLYVDIPSLEERNDKDWFRTVPITIVLAKGMIFTISTEDNVILERFMNNKVKNFNTAHKTRFILQLLYQNATAYLTYLRMIDRMTDHAEERLKGSLRNKELIELMELEKSLVYFTTSLRANELVLERLLRDSSIKHYEIISSLSIFLPEIIISPSSGFKSPLIIFRTVVFPEPDVPTMQIKSPSFILRLKFLNT